MILLIAWLSNSLAVMPFGSATAMSLASFFGFSGKVIVIASFFFLCDTFHNVPHKLCISRSTRRQATDRPPLRRGQAAIDLTCIHT